MYFIFDTETTGLPIFNTTGFHRFPNYRALDKYNSSRIVSISWIIADENGKLVKQAYHILKPADFVIDNNSKATEIHGITQEIADENGVSWDDMYNEFIKDLSTCDIVVAHNINFDASIMLSEMHRYHKKDGIKTFLNKGKLCTMKLGKGAMKQDRSPKLCDLFKHLCNEEMVNAHDAAYDTLVCYRCFVKMVIGI